MTDTDFDARDVVFKLDQAIKAMLDAQDAIKSSGIAAWTPRLAKLHKAIGEVSAIQTAAKAAAEAQRKTRA